MHFAKTTAGLDVQTKVAQELFRAHFEEEKDITRIEVLVEAGARACLDSKEAKEWLEGNHGAQEVEAEEGEVRKPGVMGVTH